MIEIKVANNTKYNTSEVSLELKSYFNQIATTENLRQQLVNQIYIITDIQKAINDNSIYNDIDKYLKHYNKSIENINGSIISQDKKISYFNIETEKLSYEKVSFTNKLALKCQEVESVFNEVAQLNAQAITGAKEYIKTQDPALNNISINNLFLQNKTKII